jgi:PTS system glucitol/sorbitol-specific IIB component
MYVSARKLPREKTGATLGLLGAILFVLAGLVIGTSGSRNGILNVDIFHVMLAIANYCLGNAILRLK